MLEFPGKDTTCTPQHYYTTLVTFQYYSSLVASALRRAQSSARRVRASKAMCISAWTPRYFGTPRRRACYSRNLTKSVPRCMALSVGAVQAFGLLFTSVVFSCCVSFGFVLAAGPGRVCALQTGGPVRVVSRHRSYSPKANPLPSKGTEGGKGKSGSPSSSSPVLTFGSRDKDLFKVSRMAGRPGKKKKPHSSSHGHSSHHHNGRRSSSKRRRLRSKVGGACLMVNVCCYAYRMHGDSLMGKEGVIACLYRLSCVSFHAR